MVGAGGPMCLVRRTDLVQSPTTIHEAVQYVAIIVVMLASRIQKLKLRAGDLLLSQDLLELEPAGIGCKQSG